MQPKKQVSLKHAVWMFALGLTFYLYEFLLRVTPGPMFADLMRDFQVEAGLLGFLSSCYLLPYALLQLPLGAFTDRIGPRRLLTGASLVCAASTIAFAYTNIFALACVARVFIGMGSAFAFVSCIKIVSMWFSPRLFALLTGLIFSVGNIGAVLGVSVLSMVLDLWSWRTVFIFLGVFGLILGGVIWQGLRDGPLICTGTVFQDFWSHLKVIVRVPKNWLFTGLAFLIVSPIDAFGGLWGTPFLVQAYGIDRTAASSAVAMAFLGIAIGSPLIGWASDFLRSRRTPLWCGTLLASITFTILIYAPTLTAWQAGSLCFLIGFFGTYIINFVALGDINTKHQISTAMGFVNGAAILASSFLTVGIGYFLDLMDIDRFVDGVSIYSASDYRIALSILPFFYFMAFLCTIFFVKETYPKND
jgi:MFS family permease